MKKFKIFLSKFLTNLLVIVLTCLLAYGIFCIKIFSEKDYAHAIEYLPSTGGETKRYAKCKANCFLFKTTDISSSNFSNVYFIVPESYFVTILAEVNSLVLKAEYAGKIGYVARDMVEVSTFTPVAPTLEGIKFSIVETAGTHIRKSPTTLENNVLTVIEAGSVNLIYIASVNGEKPAGGNSDVWYYASYSPLSDPTSIYSGYIYSEKVAAIDKIPVNQEKNPETPPPAIDDKVDSVKMSPAVKTVLILLISVPIVLVFVLLVLSNRKPRERRHHLDEDNAAKQAPVRRKKSVSDLEGKRFSKKEKPDFMFVSSPSQKSEVSPSFPTYEVIDDDDLL